MTISFSWSAGRALTQFVCCALVWGGIARLATAEESVFGFSTEAMANGGSVVIGGGGDLPEEVFQKFYELAGGKNARLVMIPSAYRFRNRAEMEDFYGGWKSFDCLEMTYLDTESREAADDEAFAAPLRRATGVWFGGGNQGRLHDIFAGTKTHQAILAVLDRGGAIGGTSAGASIISQRMIRCGSSEEAVLAQGFGLLQHAVIDQHFVQRNRFPRLKGAVNDSPSLVGIGIDENTAAVIQGNRLTVLGEAGVFVCFNHVNQPALWTRQLAANSQLTLSASEVEDENSLMGIVTNMDDDDDIVTDEEET